MMSETAFFVKDVVGPAGSVSIVSSIDDSSDIQSHSLAEALRFHPTVRLPPAANRAPAYSQGWSGGGCCRLGAAGWVLPVGTGRLAAPRG